MIMIISSKKKSLLTSLDPLMIMMCDFFHDQRQITIGIVFNIMVVQLAMLPTSSSDHFEVPPSLSTNFPIVIALRGLIILHDSV